MAVTRIMTIESETRQVALAELVGGRAGAVAGTASESAVPFVASPLRRVAWSVVPASVGRSSMVRYCGASPVG